MMAVQSKVRLLEGGAFMFMLKSFSCAMAGRRVEEVDRCSNNKMAN
jgi:hypothetical protein